MKKLFLVAAAALFALAAPAGGQTIVRCRTLGGSAVDCTAPLGNSYVNWASPGTIGSGTPAAVTATTFTGSGSGLTGVPAASITGSLSGVTIDCASNTCSNIANAALVNNSITVTAGTGLSGGGVVSLGGTVSLTLPSVGPGAGAIAYPASITLDAQGRVSAASAGSAPAPATRTITAGTGLTGGGDLSADRTLAIAATTVSAASYPTSGQIPTFTVNAQGQLTAAGSTTTLTSPAIASPTFSGSATGTYTLGGTPTITAPAISGPTLSGTVLGTYTFGGTPTFPATGVSAAAYPTAGLIPTFTVGADGRLSVAGSASSLSGVTINCSSNTCSNVSLTAAVTGVLPIANGGTNSSTALSNNRAIVSSGGKLVETSSACGSSTVLVGGSPPDCGAVPDAALSANIVTLTGSQILTSKTLTAPTISSPTFSGTEGGTRTIGGTPTLGVNLAFGGFKGTGLAAGSAAGDSGRWEQLGVAGPTFYLNTGQSFEANGYVGIAGDGSSTLAVNVVPWVVPVSCTLRNVRVFGFANTSGSVVFTIYKATAALSPSYSATVVTCKLTNTFSCTDTTHSVSLTAGELVVGFTDSSWAANGASITSQCIPN